MPLIIGLVLLAGVAGGGAAAADKAAIHHYSTPPTTRSGSWGHGGGDWDPAPAHKPTATGHRK